MAQHHILAEIEAFVARHEMAESTFGREALGDWRLIQELRGAQGRRPRRLWPETEAKVREFMSSYRETARQTGAAA